VVFFCENNGWAISLPVERQTASDSIAVKADAYGFDGIQVDGNDPFAVHEATALSLDRARDGEPVLIESLTYRQGPHTTADDPTRYADAASELPEWRTADPIDRAESYLRDHGVIEADFLERARADADAALDEAIETVGAEPPADPDDVFDHVFDELPPELADQRAWLHDFLDRHGDVNELDY
jgi:pyruvate dehydrogenase E1 component alpha subunit